MVFLVTAGLAVTVVPQLVSAAPTTLTSQFAGFVKSGLRVAVASPRPASGNELVLPTKGSSATTAVTGSGQVVIQARGQSCPGMSPILQVSVDGKVLGTQKVTATTKYAGLVFGSHIAQGKHTVNVLLTNDQYHKNVCDVNAYIGSAAMKAQTVTAPAPATSSPSTKPGPGNTGVPVGTKLTVHQGNLSVTKAGTVIDSLDIKGNLYINADNVTVKNTLIEGGPAATTPLALVAAWWGAKNITIQDSTLKAQNPSLDIDGLSGSGFTANRLNISGVVDTVKVIGPNVTVQNSWMHNNLHSNNDPNQASHTTHDDSVQVEGGSNILLQNNTMDNGHNSAIMVTQNHSVTANLTVRNNWLSGGACTINVTQRSNGGPIRGMVIQNNRFGPGSYGTTCPMLVPSTSPISISGNVWASTGAPATARKF